MAALDPLPVVHNARVCCADEIDLTPIHGCYDLPRLGPQSGLLQWVCHIEGRGKKQSWRPHFTYVASILRHLRIQLPGSNLQTEIDAPAVLLKNMDIPSSLSAYPAQVLP